MTVFCVMLLTAFAVVAHAGEPAADIHWNELAGLIAGQDISIPLERGAVAGQVLSVREDSLLMVVQRTSDPARYPKGQVAIPRANVSEIRLAEHRGSGGRVLGSVVGALLGIVAGAEIAVHGTNSEAAGVTVFSAVAVGVTVAGYYAGRGFDRNVRVLHIDPPR